MHADALPALCRLQARNPDLASVRLRVISCFEHELLALFAGLAACPPLHRIVRFVRETQFDDPPRFQGRLGEAFAAYRRGQAALLAA
eukprot:tig00020849_g14666.t1